MESYAVNARRQLHMYPEISFDLERTLAFLKSELDKMGVEYTEKYGKSSIVATINPEKDFTIGIRADIDALPIIEENDINFKSKLDGQMHACGHDVHAAIALDTCRRLNEMRENLNCRVKILFQASEEAPPSGARLMVSDGVMEGIDCMVALHVDPECDTGAIKLITGAMNATCDDFYIDFYGKSSHVAQQENGIDAITMAVRAYTAIEFMLAKEIKAKDSVIFNIGSIHGGTANNIICDKCSMYCTLRSQNEETADYILTKIKKIVDAVAETAGGSVEFLNIEHYPLVNNNPVVAEKVRLAAEKILGVGKVLPMIQGMGAEDFAHFGKVKPACMFNLGVRNIEKGYTVGLHNGKFMIDEDAMELAVNIFIQFVIDNMNGIDFS